MWVGSNHQLVYLYLPTKVVDSSGFSKRVNLQPPVLTGWFNRLQQNQLVEVVRTDIYLYTWITYILPLKTSIHVGKYTSPMDGMVSLVLCEENNVQFLWPSVQSHQLVFVRVHPAGLACFLFRHQQLLFWW